MDQGGSKVLNSSLRKLHEINNTHFKLANHWLKLKGLWEQQKYIERLDKQANHDRRLLEIEAAIRIQKWWRSIHGRSKDMQNNRRSLGMEILSEDLTKSIEDEEIDDNKGELLVTITNELTGKEERTEENNKNELRENDESELKENESAQNVPKDRGEEAAVVLEENESAQNVPKYRGEEAAAVKLQAWWRGLQYRRRMLPEHKERLVQCVREIREAPCSEANPKEERRLPLNQRIEHYLSGLLSSVLTERKAIALRLNRLANRSHVCIECMLSKNAIGVIIESLADLNRSEAHLYVIRPLCQLIVKFLLYKPFVDQFASRHLDGLLITSVKLIHNNYKDKEVVSSLAVALGLLASYAGFRDKLIALNYEWYRRKFQHLFGRLKSDDSRWTAYRQLCKLGKMLQGKNVVPTRATKL